MSKLEQSSLFAATSLDKGGNNVAEILRKYRVVNPGRLAFGRNRKVRKAKTASDAAKASYYVAAQQQRAASRKNRTSNPSKKRMTLKQKLHFGTARQRAAARAALSGAKKRVGNPRKRVAGPTSILSKGLQFNRKVRRAKKTNSKAKAMYYAGSSLRREQSRIGNPAQIITLTNPGTTRKSKGTSIMAKRKSYKRRTVGTPRKRYTRRRNTGVAMASRSYRRRRNSGVKRYNRRRNSGVLSSGFGQAFGIIGGGVVTSLITSRLPAGLNSGFAGYLSTAVVALVQGTLAGKVLKNQQLGKSMTIGGFVFLGLRLVQDFVPGLQLPFRIGAIAPSSFYTPQVPMPNSMVSFQTPAAVAAAMPMAGAPGGMGRVGRIGRAR
jgi:hypothetical protein